MLTEICAELRNWFVVPDGVHVQTYTISGGSIAPLDFLQDGQYFRIIGSVFNDGVHQYPVPDLTDEVFNGAVWAMAVPPAVIALAADEKDLKDRIKKFAEKELGYASESYPNGYSYSNYTNLPIGIQQEIIDIERRKRKWRKL